MLFRSDQSEETSVNEDELNETSSVSSVKSSSTKSSRSSGSIGSIVDVLRRKLHPRWQSPPPAPDSPTLPSSHKRTHAQRITDTPTSSPQKKKTRSESTKAVDSSPPKFSLEKVKGKVTEASKGLLSFFKKATRDEYDEQTRREFQTLREHREIRKWKQRRHEKLQKEDAREATRLQKQKSRAAQKSREIDAGMRSPGGTKKKKRKVSYKLMI